MQPVEVLKGIAAPWFGQMGGWNSICFNWWKCARFIKQWCIKSFWRIAMTRKEFIDGLIENGINPNIVNFDDDVWKDGYCVRKNYFGWEVFTRDRGIEFNAIGFPSESNALESLYESLVSFCQKFGPEYLNM